MTYPSPPTITYYTCPQWLKRRGFRLGDIAVPEPEPICRRIFLTDIQEAITATFGLRIVDMTSARRAREVAQPRQAAMYLARELTALSLPEIGRRFGNRDHTTVIHAIRRVEQYIREDPEFRAKLIEAVERLDR